MARKSAIEPSAFEIGGRISSNFLVDQSATLPKRSKPFNLSAFLIKRSDWAMKRAGKYAEIWAALAAPFRLLT